MAAMAVEAMAAAVTVGEEVMVVEGEEGEDEAEVAMAGQGGKLLKRRNSATAVTTRLQLDPFSNDI